MGFYIVPLGPVLKLLRKGTTKVFGEKEVEDLRTDLVAPVTEFVDEVYVDTVEDSWVRRVWRKRENRRNVKEDSVFQKT
jgi:hypothetical protein